MPVLDMLIAEMFQKVTDTPVACWYVNLRMVDDAEGSMPLPTIPQELLRDIDKMLARAFIPLLTGHEYHVVERVECVSVMHVRENHESAVADEAAAAPGADGAEEAGLLHGLVPFPIDGEGDFFSIGPALQPMGFEKRL